MNLVFRRAARLGWIVLPFALVTGYQVLNDSEKKHIHILQSLAFIVIVLLIARITRPHPFTQAVWRWTLPALLLTGLTALAIFASKWIHPTLAAWLGLAFAWSLAINTQIQLTSHAGRIARLVFSLWIATIAAGGAVLVAQLEARFAEEEFFLFVEWGLLTILFASLTHVQTRIWNANQNNPHTQWCGVGLPNTIITSLVLASTLVGAMLGVRAYQRSFSPSTAPSFPGIDAQHPFLCGEVSAEPSSYNGKAIYEQILGLLASNPDRDSPELGMLALGTGEENWAEQFRSNLLAEANQGEFTGPANSVKYSQFKAALRLYYYARIRNAFPQLFSSHEQGLIGSWFTAVNRRAWTVEWVDGLYALAYNRLPVGLFHNQEIGLGLLALLELEDLADPSLSGRNRAYLNTHLSGWDQRFRNSDDTLVYQQEWIYNAYFQSLLQSDIDTEQVRRSFLWLMLQALPDGSMIQMNHPVPLSQTGIAYLGAALLQDEKLLWISGRSTEFFQTSQEKMTAVPGADFPLALDARSPTYGSCALFADSGTPVQVGPLAADKLVFRDGWSHDSAYLLVNLRSTGWHRYNGTGTVTLAYQSGPLLVEQLQGDVPFWMPGGRSLFRDKRIPRENLNGLIMRQIGIGAVLHSLTGLGSEWAQDPPHYAELIRFENQPSTDIAQIRLQNWHGWQHDRYIHFIHQGPIVVIDTADGSAHSSAELVWHLPGGSSLQKQEAQSRFRLRKNNNPAEIVLVPMDPGGLVHTIENTNLNPPQLKVKYQPSQGGRLSLLTLILTRDWVGAQVSLEYPGGPPILRIVSGSRQVSLPLP